MSRTRKGGKFKGGNFASQFKEGLSMQSPMFAVSVSDGSNTAPIDNIDGTPPALSELEDVIEEKVGSSTRRTERQNWKTRQKQEGERLKAEAEAKALEEQKAEEARLAEIEREATSKGENIKDSYELEYDEDMTGKERRQESRQNKKQIRQAKKEAKQTARQEKKDAKAAAKGLKGKEKRQAKKAARKEFRADKKSIRKNKRAAKKKNRRKKRKSR